ncbi:ATP-binding protein [Streptomyces tauricus]|uniref:ATP-binding protein n=1 Tax=Streptomyces tauricus TaxID=68274 RepID=UPI003907EF2C
MESALGGEDRLVPQDVPVQDTIALDGDGVVIAQARHRAAGFLARVQAEHGLPVSVRAMDLTQLVVSELVTNACEYVPGPVLVDLRVTGAVVEVSVWDSDPVLPVAARATHQDGSQGSYVRRAPLSAVRAVSASTTRSPSVRVPTA